MKRFISLFLVACMFCALALSISAETLTTTLVRKGADPWLFKHNDYYYLVMTGGTAIHCRKAKTISGLATASVRGLYSSLTDPTVEKRFGKGAELSGTWSPEIYYFSEDEAPGNSGWYMYLALRKSTGDSSNIQMVVLKSTTDQPDGPYGHPVTGEKYHSQMVLNEDGTRYSDWACGEGMLKIPTGPYKGLYTTWVTEVGRDTSSFHQEIMISKMKNPWTLTGSPGVVTTPTQEWEYKGYGYSDKWYPKVVEGATAVYGKYGDVYITYSGSGYWSTYGLGQLTWNGGDPLKTSSWFKLSDSASYPNPIFTSRSVSFLTGAGHASFVADEDGKGFFCYHAYPSTSAGKINDATTGEPYRNAYIEPYYIDYSKNNGSGVPNTGVLVLGYKKDRAPKDPDATDIEMNFETDGTTFKLEPATITATAGSSITLSMTATDAEGYTIYRKAGSGNYTWLAETTSTTYIDRDVQADTTYSYIVYAFRNEEIAAQSNEVSAKVEPRTLWDVLLVLRYVAGDTAAIAKSKADINGDGSVTLADAIETLKSTLNG